MTTNVSTIRTWLALISLPLVLFLTWLFIRATTTRLHPDPREIPSVTYAASVPKWAEAVSGARHIVRSSLSEQNLPGLSIAVGSGSDLVWAEGFGFADLRTRVTVTPNHRFPLGTASVSLTAAAVGVLLEDGRLKLDDEIQTYVPAFPGKPWPVTIRGLMGHTAGIIPEEYIDGPLFTKHCQQAADALPYFAANALLFEPGTKHRFSTNGWTLMSAAIEAAAHQPFLSFIRDQVFAPLQMRDTIPASATGDGDDDFPLFNLFREVVFDPRTIRGTTPGPHPDLLPDRLTSYFPRFASNPNYGLHLMRPLDYSCYSGASAFLSTPSDLVRFGMAVQGGKLLQHSTVQLLQTSQRLASGNDTGYGLGWDLETVSLAGKPTRVVGHDGHSLGGMVASLVTLPEHEIVVAVASNISHADTFGVALKIAREFAEPSQAPSRD